MCYNNQDFSEHLLKVSFQFQKDKPSQPKQTLQPERKKKQTDSNINLDKDHL